MLLKSDSATSASGEHGATLAILAGGEGSRMGMPKGLLRIDGRPILEWVLDRLAWSGPTLLITGPGREHPAGWDRFGREACDAVSGEGPLRGALTALEACGTPLLVIATVDMPCVSAGQLEWLVSELVARPDCLGLMLERKGRVEPFPLTLRAAAAPTIRERLAAKRRSVHALRDQPAFAAIPVPPHWPEDTWINLNSPVDLQAFQARRDAGAQ